MPADPRPVALITGAARRIGAEIARTLHAAGYDLVLHYRHSAAEMRALCAELDGIRADSTLSVQAEISIVAQCLLAPTPQTTKHTWIQLGASTVDNPRPPHLPL